MAVGSPELIIGLEIRLGCVCGMRLTGTFGHILVTMDLTNRDRWRRRRWLKKEKKSSDEYANGIMWHRNFRVSISAIQIAVLLVLVLFRYSLRNFHLEKLMRVRCKRTNGQTIQFYLYYVLAGELRPGFLFSALTRCFIVDWHSYASQCRSELKQTFFCVQLRTTCEWIVWHGHTRTRACDKILFSIFTRTTQRKVLRIATQRQIIHQQIRHRNGKHVFVIWWHRLIRLKVTFNGEKIADDIYKWDKAARCLNRAAHGQTIHIQPVQPETCLVRVSSRAPVHSDFVQIGEKFEMKKKILSFCGGERTSTDESLWETNTTSTHKQN